MLYRDWLDEWLELYVKASTKERTYRKYRQEAEKYILPELGDYDVNAITAVRLQKFSVTLSETEYSANTVNGVLSVLKASLKLAVRLGIAKRQFSDAIVRPRIRAGKATCFSQGEQRKIERYILSQRSPSLFGILIALYTGLRIGELLALTWDDVDFQRGTLSVTKSCRDSWKDGHYQKVLGTTKTLSSERVVPIPKQIYSYLREMKRKAKGNFVVTGRTAWGAEVRSYQRTFENLLKKLKIGHRGFHALRHTFATRAIEIGMDVKTLAEILGHKNPMITLERYAHSLIEHKTAMMNKVGKLLNT